MEATAKVRCPNCNIESGARAELCYNCGTNLQTGAVPEKAVAAEGAVIHRYRNAYHHAKAICAMGSFIKGAAIAVAAIFGLGGLVMSQQSYEGPIFLVTGIVTAVAVGLPVYILGILVSAQGETLKATLDSAVHTSPFMTQDEMRSAMGLA